MYRILLTLLFQIILLAAAYSQQTVTGKVTTAFGDEPLPGVSIVVKGTTVGTTTDVEGRYSIRVPANSDVLVFSFIGYVTQEEAVGSRSVIDVLLTEDITSLEEIVVIGYGTVKEREVSGAVSTVNGDDLIQLNPVRVEQALQGQASGVVISSNSGSPGGSLNIRIRGLATNGDNNPLILVDGIPYSEDGLNALNPADIESINILKDASAAIYGVRGGNGVIFITTKQGKRNSRPTIDFNGYYGVQEAANRLDLLSAREYAVLKNEAHAAGGQAPPFNNVNLGEGTDWQDEVFERAPIQNYNISLNGGGEKNMYSIGFSYFDQEGIVGGDKAKFTRYNARINYTFDISPKLTLQNVLLYTNEHRRTLPENQISSVLYNAINASPAATIRDASGNYSYLEEVNDVINPLAQISNSFNDAYTNKIVGKQELVYKINDRFELSGRAGYNYAEVERKTFNPLVYYGSGKAQNTVSNPELIPDSLVLFSKEVQGESVEYKIPVHNNVQEVRNTYFNYNLEAFLNYRETFGGVHKVSGVIGTSMMGDRGEELSATAYNIPYNSYEFADISMADGANLMNNTSSFQYRSRLMSVFVRGEYSYQDRYLFTAILRRDGSSRFGKEEKIGYFPSVSAAWIMSDENFFSSEVVNFVKMRASFGTLGSDRFDNDRFLALLNGEAVYPFNDQLVNGVAIGTIANPYLKWETSRHTNFGVDLELFNSKVNVTTDFYIKSTSDLLFQPDVSGITGAYGAGGNPPWVNGGSIRNKGIELGISYSDEITNDLSFNISYNLTTIHNEVTSLPKKVSFYEFGAFGVGGETATRMQVGLPIGYFFGYKTEGVYQSATEVAERGITQPGAQPGDLKFADVSGDGSITFGDDADKTIIGSPIPDVTMGLNLGINFKGFDFASFFYASIGNDILRNYERQQPLANLLSYRLQRWTGENSTNEHPRLTTGATNNNVISDYFVEDGSFLRIKNIQLGYSLPASIAEKIGARKLRLYVSVNNLYTFTKYRGYDPDLSTDDPRVSGIDFGFYPQARTYMAGFNFNF